MTSLTERIKEHQWDTEKLVSSTAVRALTTAKVLATAFYHPVAVEPEARLYTFDQEELLRYLKNLPDSLASIAIIGHNPAMEEIFNYLSADSPIEKFPTCAVGRFELEINSWQEIHQGCGYLDEFEYPKKYT